MNANDSLQLDGADIAKVLSSKGPVVKCVLLHASLKSAGGISEETLVGTKNGEEQKDRNDTKPEASENVIESKLKSLNEAKEDNDEKKEISIAAVSEDSVEGGEEEEDMSSQEEKKDASEESVTRNHAVPSRTTTTNTTSHTEKKREILVDLMEEIEIDTTPSKSMVSKTLGGPFTFLGQYEDEGIVLMIRKPEENQENDDKEDDEEGSYDLYDHQEAKDHLTSLNLSELRKMCREADISTEGMLEKIDLVNALLDRVEQTQQQKQNLPPINPHQLQPPLHKSVVHGDILVMKVAATGEELDDDNEDKNDKDDEDDGNEEKKKQVNILTNDDFFLDYTKEEFITFASRTDIPEYELTGDADAAGGSDEEEEEYEEEEEAYIVGDDDDEEIDEDDKPAMLNFVMNEVLRKYREDNGRGPDTRELLELRAAIAKQLDVEVAEVDAAAADWDQKTSKAQKSSKKRTRRIAFSSDTKTGDSSTAAAAVSSTNDDNSNDNGDEDDKNEEEAVEESEEPVSKKQKLSSDDDGDGEQKGNTNTVDTDA